MPESNKPFVVTDRRKFTSEGELRPDAVRSSQESGSQSSAASDTAAETPTPAPQASAPQPPVQAEPRSTPESSDEAAAYEDSLPAPTAEQTEQSRFAYQQTADRLETAIRAANPGADHPPAMNFDQLVQSIYLTAIMQLGGATPEGQKPQVDILGARQSIDMLGVLAEKTKGNLSSDENRLLDSALFELRIAFLEFTQALARSAAPKGPSAVPRPGVVL